MSASLRLPAMLKTPRGPPVYRLRWGCHSWEYLPKLFCSHWVYLCILIKKCQYEDWVVFRGESLPVRSALHNFWSEVAETNTKLLLISAVFMYKQTQSIWPEFTAIKCDDKETMNMGTFTLSIILEKEKKLPSRYHEHICFVDHDMGKILAFCKSSIFHDL